MKALAKGLKASMEHKMTNGDDNLPLTVIDLSHNGHGINTKCATLIGDILAAGYAINVLNLDKNALEFQGASNLATG